MFSFLAQAEPPPPIRIPEVEYSAMLPELVLIGAALLLLTISALGLRRPPRGFYGLYMLATSALSLAACAAAWGDVSDRGPFVAVADAIVVDGFSVFFKVVIAASVGIGALLADGYLRREGLDGPEFHVLVLLSASGGMVMAGANDLIVLFLGLEILSIALYVLAGFHGRSASSREAAMKYFVLGAFSSALFLYGVALVYGATGTTQLAPGVPAAPGQPGASVAGFLATEVVVSNGVLVAGMALLLVGLAFKVAAVPFHTWTPDVYQGAPTPAVGLMASIAKAAGFAGLLRIFFSTFATLRLDWRPVVLVLAVLTMALGSIVAVVQTDVKRMLAYSSISHAGYILVGLQAASADGIAASLFYVLAYSFMVLGTFGVVGLVGRRGDGGHDLEAYRGLAARRPALALVFAVLLLAQAGAPFTSGFLAKFYVISAAVESGSYALAIVAMLMAAVAAFFYLRLVLVVFSTPSDADAAEPTAPSRIPVPVLAGAALAVTVAVTIGVGLVPSPIIDFARNATLL